VLTILALGLLYLVRLSVDEAWVGFRAGHLILVAVPAFGARFFAVAFERAPRLFTPAVLAVLLAGLPTTLIDEYNAQDIHNVAMSPGQAPFPWTIVVSADQQAAFRWIREQTAPDAVVQMDPVERGRATWSLIPSFAQRRMAGGNALPLLRIPAYEERSQQVHAMYGSSSTEQASAIAHSLGIDYVYVDDVERHAHDASVFDSDPGRFAPVFRAGSAAVYRVQ